MMLPTSSHLINLVLPLYQDEEANRYGCKSCPRGYQNKTSIGSPTRETGYALLSDVCELCPVGKFKSADAPAQMCEPCPIGTYASAPGSLTCTPCPNNKTTVSSGANSSVQCVCPPDQFDPSVTGSCRQCGRCRVGEYVVSSCNNYADVQCAPCRGCAKKNAYVNPQSLCKGYDKDANAQQCLDCKDSTPTSLTLTKCLSGGRISLDTTLRVDVSGQFVNPLEFQCPEGKFLQRFSPLDVDPLTSFADGSALVYLSPDNSMVAELFANALTIYRTPSALNPFTKGQILLSVFSTAPQTFRADLPGLLNSTFVSPSSPSTGTWAFDSSSFFLVWADGTISRWAVGKNFTYAWSVFSTAQHPAPTASPPFVRGQQCVAVPLHDAAAVGNAALQPGRQIQLHCLFNFVNSTAGVSSYLSRVMGDGARLTVVQKLSSASTSLVYDVQFNSLYVTCHKIPLQMSGPKQVLRMRLGATYDYFDPQLRPTPWLMPVLDKNTYPMGITLDHAAVEPLSGVLFFYVPTLAPGSSDLENVLYYISAEPDASFERSTQPVLLSSAEQSPYASGLMLVVSSGYPGSDAPRLVFTLYTGLWVCYAWLTSTYHQLARCASCPLDKTSDRGSLSRDQCFCKPGTFANATTGVCQPVRSQCPAGYFIAAMETATRDKACVPCPACQPGFYRDPNDCKNAELRDPLKPPVCLPCTGCGEGFYIDPARCNGRGTSPGTRADNCRPCTICPDMTNKVGSACPGNTPYDTVMCQSCVSTCPAGTYISPVVERCSGKTFATKPDDSTRPFDPSVGECIPCAQEGRSVCPYADQVPVSGCAGDKRFNDAQCEFCASCPVGKYISAESGCTPTGTGVPPVCIDCPLAASCGAGEYLARLCSGRSIGAPDHVCLSCAPPLTGCPKDTYVAQCGADDNRTNFSTSSGADGWLPVPADAGRCVPCRNCSVGSYISRRCSGLGLSDDRECAACTTTCPYGSYMHARCSGATLVPDSNDCRCVECI